MEQKAGVTDPWEKLGTKKRHMLGKIWTDIFVWENRGSEVAVEGGGREVGVGEGILNIHVSVHCS